MYIEQSIPLKFNIFLFSQNHTILRGIKLFIKHISNFLNGSKDKSYSPLTTGMPSYADGHRLRRRLFIGAELDCSD